MVHRVRQLHRAPDPPDAGGLHDPREGILPGAEGTPQAGRRAGGAAHIAAAEGNTMQLMHDVYFTLNSPTPENREKMVQECLTYLKGHDGMVAFTAGTRVEDNRRDVNDTGFDVSMHAVFDQAAARRLPECAAAHGVRERNSAGWRNRRSSTRSSAHRGRNKQEAWPSECHPRAQSRQEREGALPGRLPGARAAYRAWAGDGAGILFQLRPDHAQVCGQEISPPVPSRGRCPGKSNDAQRETIESTSGITMPPSGMPSLRFPARPRHAAEQPARQGDDQREDAEMAVPERKKTTSPSGAGRTKRTAPSRSPRRRRRAS